MKIKVACEIKLPVEGIQYSNIGVSYEQEVDTDDPEKSRQQLKEDIREWVEEQVTVASGQIQTQLENLNSRLKLAREEYIKLQESK